MSVLLSPQDARALIWNALTGSGTAPENAGYFTDAILDTELSGLEGHGFYWLQYYCAHLRSGKVDGKAVPQIEALSDTSLIPPPTPKKNQSPYPRLATREGRPDGVWVYACFMPEALSPLRRSPASARRISPPSRAHR